MTRIVKMTFVPEKIPAFLEIFAASRDKIRNFEGCTHLELLRDAHEPNIIYTLSRWENDASLQRYRNSEVFKSTWSKTRVLFEERAVVFSMSELNN